MIIPRSSLHSQRLPGLGSRDTAEPTSGVSASDHRDSTPAPPKVIACLACRAVKAKCEASDQGLACTRCVRREQECERPALNKSGRPKGSKNLHSSLERALKVIEREVQSPHAAKRPRIDIDSDVRSTSRSTSRGAPTNPSDNPIFAFPPAAAYDNTQQRPTTLVPAAHSIISPMTELSGVNQLTSGLPQPHHQFMNPSPRSSMPQLSEGSLPYDLNRSKVPPSISPHSLASHQSNQSAEIGYEHDGGLSNPVRLLAEAAEESSNSSYHAETVTQTDPVGEDILPPQYHLPETLHAMLASADLDRRSGYSGLDPEYLSQGLEKLLSDRARRSLDNDDKRFFKPARREVKRDIGPEYNPLSLALVTKREVKAFFGSFFSKLHPMLPVLDPALHTPEFVESRSAFLLSAICAQGASLTPGAEQATKRLRIHTQRLSDLISRRGFASVEIVTAFLIWISWLPSSESFQEERLWHETKYAINMAVELGLAKPLPLDQQQLLTDPSLAACLDGIQLDVWDKVERIIRNRQRLWIHLFLWDSSLSLAFGKATRFTQDDLIRDETWCFSRLATKEDVVTTACVVLRRLLVGLSDILRSEIQIKTGMTSEWVAEKIDEHLEPWYKFWTSRCDGSAYLELVFRHTRLWSLSYALQGLTSRGGSAEALSKDCFSAALSSCEFVCQQLSASKGLWGFPNTMGPMLSFEALLAIRLFPDSDETALAARARLLGLLSQLSLLLEQIGTTPPHRLGTAAVYGRHLQVYIRRRVIALCLSHHQHEISQIRAGGDSSGYDFLFGSDISPMRSAEASINQLFASNRVSPTDQTQASMNLNWDGSTLNFLDTTSGWTDEFFRLFGGEQE